MINRTIGSIFSLVAAERRDKKAIVYDDEFLTYGELLSQAKSLASALHEKGLDGSCRIAVLSENNPLFVVSFIAVNLLGATFVPLSVRAKDGELVETLSGIGCSGLIYSAMVRNKVSSLSDAGALPGVLFGQGESLVEGASSFDEAIADAGKTPPPLSGSFDLRSPAALLFTGGTTGKAKGALLSHESFISDAISDSKDCVMYGPDGVILSAAPLSHRAALSYLYKTLLSGGTFVMATQFDPPKLLKTIEDEAVTCVFVIPGAFIHKLHDEARCSGRVFPAVRVIILGGSDVSVESMRAAWEIFPNACIQRGYSHTENAAHTIERIYRDDFDERKYDRRGIGRPRLYTQIKIYGNDGEELGRGEIGEAWARSLWQMSGYVGDESCSEEWIRTGDILRWNEDDTFSFVGRTKDVIKTGGENVFCSEVENVILQMPEVSACVVFGRPDQMYGERICVAIILRPGCSLSSNDVIEFCRSRMAGYKKPREVLFCESFPLTAVGKIDKLALSRGI